MADKKYKLDKSDTISANGKKCYRIVALRSFSDVKEGDEGGYVGSYNNLSQDGNCWIYDDAIVFGGGTSVEDNATIRGYVTITDKSKIYGNAKVSNIKHKKGISIERTEIYENAEYSVNTVPGETSFTFFETVVGSKLHGNAKINSSKILTAEIKDNAVMDNAYTHAVNVFGNTVITGIGLASNGKFGSCPTVALKSKSDVLSLKTTAFTKYEVDEYNKYIWIDKSITKPITSIKEIDQIIDSNFAEEAEAEKSAEKAREAKKTNESFVDAVINLLDNIKKNSDLTKISAYKESSNKISFNCYGFDFDSHLEEIFFTFSLDDSKLTGNMTTITDEEYDHFWPYDSGPKNVKDDEGDYGYLYQFKIKLPTIKFKGGVNEAAYAFFEEIFSAPYLANEEVSEQYYEALQKVKA